MVLPKVRPKDWSPPNRGGIYCCCLSYFGREQLFYCRKKLKRSRPKAQKEDKKDPEANQLALKPMTFDTAAKVAKAVVKLKRLTIDETARKDKCPLRERVMQKNQGAWGKLCNRILHVKIISALTTIKFSINGHTFTALRSGRIALAICIGLLDCKRSFLKTLVPKSNEKIGRAHV